MLSMMSSQHERQPSGYRGQDDRQRKCDQSPSHEQSGSRRKRTRLPSPACQLNAAAILSHVLPEWEIEETTHIPIHRGNCKDCIQFALHVTSQAQGSASNILIDKQRRHWCKVLEGEFSERLDEKRQANNKEKDEEIKQLRDEADELKDRLDRCHSQIDILEDDKDNLQCKVRRLRDELHRLDNAWQGTFSKGRACMEYVGYDTRERVYACSPRQLPPHRSSPIRSLPSLQLIDRIGSAKTSPQPLQRILKH